MPDTHTAPWMQEEYIYVDGKPYVYTVRRLSNDLLVRFPGGERIPVNDLILDGHNVRMPKVIRRRATP